MNLMMEYRSRHKSSFVWGVDEGIIFFNKDKKPSLVVAMSSHTRSIRTCDECRHHYAGIIVEITGVDVSDDHSHVPPDCNVVQHIEKRGFEGYDLFIPHSERDVEVWLWDFFCIKHHTVFPSLWKHFVAGQKGKRIKRWQEQVMFVLDHMPSVFDIYYQTYFANFLIGRKYLVNR